MPIDTVADGATTSTLHGSASYYAELGFPVFPCWPGEKKPATKHGFLDATTDIDQIDAWWTANPNYNVGIATAGLLVVDIDGENNPWLTPDRASDLATASQRTPRGGWHYWFRQPVGAGLRNTESRIAPNIDTRANGGYAVVAPSIVGSGQYEWVEPLDCPATLLPEPPEWLMGELDQAANRKTDRQTDHTADGGTYSEGSRNSRLTSFAGYLRRGGATEEEILAGLYVRNRRCKPPLPEDELHKIAASVARYEPEIDPTDNTDEPVLNFTDFADLIREDLRVEFLVEGILPAGKHGFIAGPSKSCKSTIALQLAFSVATGQPFLGEFAVPKPAPVLVISSEAGRDAVQWYLGLCFKSACLDPEDHRGMIHIETDIPDGGIRSDKVLAALRETIERTGAKLLILDPKYLLAVVSPDSMSNLDAAGEELKKIARLSADTGCTIAIVDHTRKNRLTPSGEPITLEEIYGAGGAANARWWLLLSRESPYDHDAAPGYDSLWLSTGGGLGMGHGGTWNVGLQVWTWRTHGEDHIEVTVTPRSEVARQKAAERDSAVEDRERRKERDREARVARHMEVIREALRSFRDAGTIERKSAIKGAANLSGTYFGAAWERLRLAGEVESVTEDHNGKRGEFWVLKAEWDEWDDHGTTMGSSCRPTTTEGGRPVGRDDPP